MIRKIEADNTAIEYDLQYKKVKNINLRIKSDGSIYVSANKRVPQKVIDDFILSKETLILKALEKIKGKPKQRYYSESEVKELITQLCKKLYPYYEARGVKYPKIKF